MSIRKRPVAGSVNEKARKVVPWVQVRAEIKRRRAAGFRNGDDSFGGDDPRVLPFAHRLGSGADQPRQFAVAPDLSGGKVKSSRRRIVITDGRVGGGSDDRHEAKLHQWLNSFNRIGIAPLRMGADNQPMVDDIPTPLPLTERIFLEGYKSFTEWLKALMESRHGMAALCARQIGVKSQNIDKWLNGSLPGKPLLKKLAIWSGVDYFDLQLLAFEIERTPEAQAPADNQRWTQTAMGAVIGRKWEQLHGQDPQLAMSISNMLDAQINALLTREQSRPVEAGKGRRRA